jgi:hypothetical protein
MEDNVEDNILESVEIVQQTTNVVLTPETESRFGIDGTFYLYSTGMKDNYDLPDLEIRGVPGMLINAAVQTINEINGYRLVSDKPFLVGHKVDWAFGKIRIEQGDDWNGRVEWKAEDMLRLTSLLSDVECCVGCECEKHGVTE